MSTTADAEGEYDHTADDERKVFVSRLPKRWDDATLALHFGNIFGPVESATIRQEQKIDTSDAKACYVCGAVGHVSRECPRNPGQGFVPAPTVSRGFGFVVFVDAASKKKALAQRTIHVQQRTIQIREVARDAAEWSGGTGGDGASSEAGGGGGAVGRCFLWEQFACPRGDACKFSHDGEGGCVKVSAPGTSIAKCFAFKKKGRCSKGDQCPFRHVAREPSSISAAKDLSDSGAPRCVVYSVGGGGGGGDNGGGADGTSAPAPAPASAKVPGICDSWKKKGKCRKGDRCKYLHTTTPAAAGKAAIATHTKFGDGGAAGSDDATKEGHGEGGKKRRKIDGLALIHAKSAVAVVK